MTKVTHDLKMTDREMLRVIIASQMELAGILFKMNFGHPGAREAAGLLHENLTQVLSGIPRQPGFSAPPNIPK